MTIKLMVKDSSNFENKFLTVNTVVLLRPNLLGDAYWPTQSNFV